MYLPHYITAQVFYTLANVETDPRNQSKKSAGYVQRYYGDNQPSTYDGWHYPLNSSATTQTSTQSL